MLSAVCASPLCASVHARICVSAWLWSPEKDLKGHLSGVSHLLHFETGLSLAWGWMTQLDWLAGEPWDRTVHLPCIGHTSTCHHTQLFAWVLLIPSCLLSCRLHTLGSSETVNSQRLSLESLSLVWRGGGGGAPLPFIKLKSQEAHGSFASLAVGR